MEVVYQHDLVKICYKREEKLLQVSWKSYLTSEDFMLGLRALLRLTAELEIEKWLIDARYADELVLKNLCWSKEYIGAALAQCKLRKIARIGAGNPNVELETRKFIKYLKVQYQLPAQIRLYNNAHQALAWLSEKEQNKPALSSALPL